MLHRDVVRIKRANVHKALKTVPGTRLALANSVALRLLTKSKDFAELKAGV